MTQASRKIIRQYVKTHGRDAVAKAAQVSTHAIESWLRPESNRAHRTPSTQSLLILAATLGKRRKK